MSENETAVWVESDRTMDDRFIATIHVNDDLSIPLSRSHALSYAAAAIRWAGIAEFEAAVAAQVRATAKEGDGDENVVVVLSALRQRRNSPPESSTKPLRYTPIVSARDGRPYVQVHIEREPLTQWTPEDVRQHAMHVLECAVAAELDGQYFSVLAKTIGTPAEVARAAVMGLREHRRPS